MKNISFMLKNFAFSLGIDTSCVILREPHFTYFEDINNIKGHWPFRCLISPLHVLTSDGVTGNTTPHKALRKKFANLHIPRTKNRQIFRFRAQRRDTNDISRVTETKQNRQVKACKLVNKKLRSFFFCLQRLRDKGVFCCLWTCCWNNITSLYIVIWL